MRLVFAFAAIGDLNDIVDYIALENPAAAQRVYRAIVAATERLREFPGIGHQGHLPGTREWPIPSLPYVIVYDVAGGTMMIIAILHGARDLKRALAARRRKSKHGKRSAKRRRRQRT